jgi:hypothetical protein
MITKRKFLDKAVFSSHLLHCISDRRPVNQASVAVTDRLITGGNKIFYTFYGSQSVPAPPFDKGRLQAGSSTWKRRKKVDKKLNI